MTIPRTLAALALAGASFYAGSATATTPAPTVTCYEDQAKILTAGGPTCVQLDTFGACVTDAQCARQHGEAQR